VSSAKTATLVAILASLLAGTMAHATDYTKPEQYNPRNDPDVERGYQESQRYNRERQAEENRKERGELPWSVDISGQDSIAGKRDK
jgi:hypothetical protein